MRFIDLDRGEMFLILPHFIPDVKYRIFVEFDFFLPGAVDRSFSRP